MSKDSSHTYIHFKTSRQADLFEDFSRPAVPPSEPILIPPHLLPPNPEDEDDVVPDQHAAFGIQRATQPRREPAWRDLDLEAMLREDMAAGSGGGGAAAAATEGRGSATGTGSAATAAPEAEPGQGEIVGRPGLGRGQGWAGVRSLPR